MNTAWSRHEIPTWAFEHNGAGDVKNGTQFGWSMFKLAKLRKSKSVRKSTSVGDCVFTAMEKLCFSVENFSLPLMVASINIGVVFWWTSQSLFSSTFIVLLVTSSKDTSSSDMDVRKWHLCKDSCIVSQDIIYEESYVIRKNRHLQQLLFTSTLEKLRLLQSYLLHGSHFLLDSFLSEVRERFRKIWIHLLYLCQQLLMAENVR